MPAILKVLMAMAFAMPILTLAAELRNIMYLTKSVFFILCSIHYTALTHDTASMRSFPTTPSQHPSLT